ncbi:MAG: hypothetical protein ABWZ74_01295 [Hyphomicrobiaceae bacterium]|jgi:hypothetical protein
MQPPRKFDLKGRDQQMLQNILVILWVIAIMLIGFYLLDNLYGTPERVKWPSSSAP